MITPLLWILFYFAPLIGFFVFLFTGGWWMLGSIPFLAWFIIDVKTSVYQVQEDQRFLMERWGAYHRTAKPGLRFRVLVADKLRAPVITAQQEIEIFTSPIKIDFKDGSATPKEGEAYVEIVGPDDPYKDTDNAPAQDGCYRSIYRVNNWREGVKDMLQNACRSFFNSLNIDQALEEGQGGYNIYENLPEDRKNGLRAQLKVWGFRLVKLTIGDFDLDPNMVKERNRIQEEKARLAAAEFERQQKATGTMGFLISSVAQVTGLNESDIKSQIAGDPELQKQYLAFAQKVLQQTISVEGKALQHIIVDGGGDLQNSLAALIKLFKS